MRICMMKMQSKGTRTHRCNLQTYKYRWRIRIVLQMELDLRVQIKIKIIKLQNRLRNSCQLLKGQLPMQL